MKESVLWEQNNDKHARPEDDLETPEVAEVNRRERKFGAESGFKDMLRLKIAAHDMLLDEKGFLQRNRSAVITDVIENPRRHISWLTDHTYTGKTEDIGEEEMRKIVDVFLLKFQADSIAEIDYSLQAVRDYASRFDSHELKPVEGMLEEAKALAQAADWKGFEQKQIECVSFLGGMESLLDTACGDGVENDETRRVLKIEKTK